MPETKKPSRRVAEELQNFFYVISQVEPEVPRLNPDGIYTEETAEAVRVFQKKIMGRPDPDGRVDYETWRQLVSHYHAAEARLREPRTVSPFRIALKNGVLSPGDKCDLVLMIKLMMNTLALEYRCAENVPLTEEYDEALTDAIRQFQVVHGLPETGAVDRATWDRLAMAYDQLTSNGE